jgi:tetratricopeptide (TPR) repeat protein
MKLLKATIILLLFMIFTTAILCAQKGGLEIKELTPDLCVEVNGKKKALKMVKLDVDIKIIGKIAQTRQSMRFYNPHGRILEGEFAFPLPEGSTVCRYALDVQGKMVAGVVVEKKKARLVFEKLVRQKIDPGIVEWIGSSTFKTRIFPIPAKGSRTVEISYISDLANSKEKSFYQLPLNYQCRVKEFTLHIEVIKAPFKPTIKESRLDNFLYNKWRESYVAESHLKNHFLGKNLFIELPQRTENVHRIMVQVELADDGNYYFTIHHKPDYRYNRKDLLKTTHHIVVLWDASDSRRNSDIAREISLLESFLGQFHTKVVKVDLVSFHIFREKTKSFFIKKGNIHELVDEIKKIKYDGATSLSCITSDQDSPIPDYYVLFSDGNFNYVDQNLINLKAPLFILSSSLTSNHPYLKHLAMSTGGNYFYLKNFDDSVIIKSIGHSPFSFISVDYDNAVISDPFPKTAQPILDNFSLTGKLLKPEGKITIYCGIGGKIKKKVTYSLSQKNGIKGNLLKTYWAQKKVEDLLIFRKKNMQELIDTGKEYGLVTPGTSLMVLESLAQYLEYEIEPPRSLPKIRKQYMAQISKKPLRQDKLKPLNLDEIKAAWESRQIWWKTDYAKISNKITTGIWPHPQNPWKILESVPGIILDRSNIAKDEDITWNIDGANLNDLNIVTKIGAAPAYLNLNSYTAEDGASSNSAIMYFQEWNPESSYLKILKSLEPEKAYEEYTRLKSHFKNSPGFFMDCSELFLNRDEKETSLLILSNIAEMEFENPQLLRILGHRLLQLEQLASSTFIFKKVLELRGEEPQSYRDLALVLARQEKYKEAIKLLYFIVKSNWDRFKSIKSIALMEMNNLIGLVDLKELKDLDIDPQFIKLLDVDLRIVLTWDTDLADLDLWIIEPSGEKVNYLNSLSQTGGLLSRDIIDGYGPEEYILKKAKKGEYTIKVNYFGSSSRKLLGPVTLKVDIFTDYGRPNQKKRSKTLVLKEKKDIIIVGKVNF